MVVGLRILSAGLVLLGLGLMSGAVDHDGVVSSLGEGEAGEPDYYSAIEPMPRGSHARDMAAARAEAEKEAHVVAMEEEKRAKGGHAKEFPGSKGGHAKKLSKKKEGSSQRKKASKKKSRASHMKPPPAKKKLHKMSDGARVFENAADKEYSSVMSVFNKNQMSKPKKGQEDLGDTEQTGWGAIAAVSSTTMFSLGVEESKELGESKIFKPNVAQTYKNGAKAPNRAGLMNLIPLWKAVAFSRNRARRSGVYLGCVMSLKQAVERKLCARKRCKRKKRRWVLDPNGRRKCRCTRWLLKPLNQDMRTLLNNARKSFCTKKNCDATVCYTPPGRMNRWSGKMRAPGYKTLRYKNTYIRHGSRMIQVFFNMGAYMEKVTFCEKLNPPAMVKGVIQNKKCMAFKKCMVPPGSTKTRRCLDASQTPMRRLTCPTSARFNANFQRKVADIVSVICSKM